MINPKVVTPTVIPTIFIFIDLLDVLDDQMVLFVALRSSRIPFSLSFRTPELFSRDVFLFATHTTVRRVTFLYHISKYRLVEFQGPRKPASIILKRTVSFF